MRLRLTNPAGEIMHVSPGTVDAQVFLSIKLAPYGVRVELVSEDGKTGLASGKRIATAPPETPPRDSLGRHLFRLGQDLAARAAGRHREE